MQGQLQLCQSKFYDRQAGSLAGAVEGYSVGMEVQTLYGTTGGGNQWVDGVVYRAAAVYRAAGQAQSVQASVLRLCAFAWPLEGCREEVALCMESGGVQALRQVDVSASICG